MNKRFVQFGYRAVLAILSQLYRARIHPDRCTALQRSSTSSAHQPTSHMRREAQNYGYLQRCDSRIDRVLRSIESTVSCCEAVDSTSNATEHSVLYPVSNFYFCYVAHCCAVLSYVAEDGKYLVRVLLPFGPKLSALPYIAHRRPRAGSRGRYLALACECLLLALERSEQRVVNANVSCAQHSRSHGAQAIIQHRNPPVRSNRHTGT